MQLRQKLNEEDCQRRLVYAQLLEKPENFPTHVIIGDELVYQ